MRRIPATHRTLEVAEARALSPSVREIVLRTVDGSAVDYLPGQWIKLYFGGEIDRDYSIATAPRAERADRFAIAVTRVDGGPASEALHRIDVGARLESLGPSGLFVREDEEAELPAIYVGTGTGLAPLRAMIDQELRRGDGPPQVLLFGCRTEEEILWREELEEWAREHPRFVFEPTLSRATGAWGGRRGWVQHHLPSIVGARLAESPASHLYVCGLSKMVSDVRKLLKEEIRVDRRFVHSERYD